LSRISIRPERNQSITVLASTKKISSKKEQEYGILKDVRRYHWERETKGQRKNQI
jgi:hypothetical protein